jgi:xanthosine utilization system XapX-like protein
MGHKRDAALIGGLTGLLHGILNAFELQYLLLPMIMPIVTSQILERNPNASTMLPTVWNTLMSIILFFVVAFSLVIGIVLGIVFVSLKERIPGSSTILKSLTFSLILLAVQLVSGLGTLSIAAYLSTAINLDLISIVEFPLLGLLFGCLLEWKTRTA